MDMLSLEDILLDCLFGAIVVGVSIGGFILILWLREQIILHGGPEWLNANDQEFHFFQFNNVLRNIFGRGLDQQQPLQFQANPNVIPNNNIGEEGHHQVGDNLGGNVEQEQGVENPDNIGVVIGDMEAVGGDVDDEEADEDGAENIPLNDGAWNAEAIMEDLTWEKFLG